MKRCTAKGYHLVIALVVLILKSPAVLGFVICNETQRLYHESSSCYNLNPNDKTQPGVDRFDVSMTTFGSMVGLLNDTYIQVIQTTSVLHNTLPTLLEELRELGIPASAKLFFYYDNDSDGNGNSDCSLYYVDPLRPKIDLEPCDDTSYQFAVLFKAVTEPQGVVLISPFQEYLFADHPNPEVAEYYSSAYIDNWILFNRKFAVPLQWLSETGREIVEVRIPVWSYVNENETSFMELKDTLNLDVPWQLLWEVNIDNIRNPMKVNRGARLSVPVSIDTWKEVEHHNQTSEELSRELYGDASYAELVEYLRYRGGDAENVYLPVFELPQDVKPASVILLEKFWNYQYSPRGAG